MPFILSGPFQGPLIDVATFPTPHEAYGLCAAGLPQFKAAGLAVVFDLTAHTFYRVSPSLSDLFIIDRPLYLKGGFFCQNVTF